MHQRLMKVFLKYWTILNVDFMYLPNLVAINSIISELYQLVGLLRVDHLLLCM